MLYSIIDLISECTDVIIGILGFQSCIRDGSACLAVVPLECPDVQEAWIAAAIAAATAIAGGVAKSVSARRAAAKRQAEINRQRAAETALYNKRFYEDGTQRADVRRALTEANARLQRNSQGASGRNAMTGGTNAESAAAKEVNNEAYASMVSKAAAGAEVRREAAEERFSNRSVTISDQQSELDAQRAADKQSAITDAAGNMGGIASAVEQGYNSYKAKN